MKKKKSKIKIVPSKVATEYDCTSSDIIRITEDKLRAQLESYEKSSAYKHAIPLYGSLFLTVLIALITSNFNNFIFGNEIWQAIFTVLSCTFFVLTLYNWYKYYSKKKSIEELIKDIKKDA